MEDRKYEINDYFNIFGNINVLMFISIYFVNNKWINKILKKQAMKLPIQLSHSVYLKKKKKREQAKLLFLWIFKKDEEEIPSKNKN